MICHLTSKRLTSLISTISIWCACSTSTESSEGRPAHVRSAFSKQGNRKCNSSLAADPGEAQERGLHSRRSDPSSHSPPRGRSLSILLAGLGEGSWSGVECNLPQPIREPRGNGRIYRRSGYLYHSIPL